MEHYLIQYRPPRPTFADDATDTEAAIIGRHFDYLKQQFADGRVLMIGRVDDARFGLALVVASSEGDAQEIMEGDPAISEGVFTGELLPFRLAMITGRDD